LFFYKSRIFWLPKILFLISEPSQKRGGIMPEAVDFESCSQVPMMSIQERAEKQEKNGAFLKDLQRKMGLSVEKENSSGG